MDTKGKTKRPRCWEFPVVQWLRLWAFPAEGPGSISGWETKILHTVWHAPSTEKTKKRPSKEDLNR